MVKNPDVSRQNTYAGDIFFNKNKTDNGKVSVTYYPIEEMGECDDEAIAGQGFLGNANHSDCCAVDYQELPDDGDMLKITGVNDTP